MADKNKGTAAGDAPTEKKPEGKGKGKGKEEPLPPEPEEIPKTASEIAREEAEYRAMLRKNRFKKRWPEVTKVQITTRPWKPPPPPERLPPIIIEQPEFKTRKWVPPYMKRRRRRPRLPRIPAEEITQPLYECAKLRRIWHNFMQIEKNKMILQGTVGCNSKKYSSTACGSQTGCIAVICRALLEEKSPAQLVRRDVDEVIEWGDRFYKRCMLALKCYKGKPQLQLNQLLTSFYLYDKKYTVKMTEAMSGLLAKHPDNIQAQADLMALMEKLNGNTYMMILSIDGERHFLIWGHPPPPEANSTVKTICYIFDPHMLNELGQPNSVYGAGAFIRYAGITSFVLDFLANYGDLSAAKRGSPKPPITLTNIEVVQIEPLTREPKYELDLKALKTHCQSEWESIHMNMLIEKKLTEGQYPLASLSAVSLATSRATSRKKVREFYQKVPKEPPPTLPIPPEKPPPAPTQEQIMSLRGEDFFLYSPRTDAHTYGRDDLIPLPKSETILHSPVEIADQNFHSQFQQMDVEKWILHATRHMASYRYQTFKTFTSIACCVAALAMLRRLRARAWNDDILDETLDLGYNIYRESLLERGGPIRRLVLGEIKETFRIRDHEYKHKERGIAVWGKILSSDPKVFDLCRGIEAFFKESDAGVLQIPGEYEVAIWNEGGRYYIYHPWPADRYGYRVGLQDGGKACLLYFTRVSRLCEHLLDCTNDMKRKPFSISDVTVQELGEMPEPVNKLKPVAPNRWVVRGRFHEADERFPEEHRGRQATPASIAAIALAHIVDPSEWTADQIDESLTRGDILYQNTMENLERMGISLDTTTKTDEAENVEEEEEGGTPGGTLAAADVLDKFRISDYDCIETDILDSAYTGELNPKSNEVMSLKQSLRQLFREHSHAVVTARGASNAVWKHDEHFYFFDPHACDENGYPSDDARAAACLVRVKGGPDALADVILGNLPPGSDDSFNLSPVAITATRLNEVIGAPETKLESKAFQWISKGTAAIMMGPRGENSAIGKAAERAGVGEDDMAGRTIALPAAAAFTAATASVPPPHMHQDHMYNFLDAGAEYYYTRKPTFAIGGQFEDDMAGRTIALPAAAAFTAATASVPPPHMHQDHMYNFLDAGAEYYLNHVKKTGRKEVTPEDLTEKFEMGANTFSIELEEPVTLPLRLPDEPQGEGGEEEAENDELGENAEEEEVKEKPMKQIKDALFRMWEDPTKPNYVCLLVGDYHQLGVWLTPGGKVVAFDPAPTLMKGLLTPQRIKKGDELRLQRIKDEMAGEGAEEAEDEEAEGEGEEKPEPEPEYVPPESTPALMVFASPGEFLDKMTLQGGLDRKQCLAPYKLYKVKVINELTSVLKERKPKPEKTAEGDEGGDEDEEDEDALIEPLEDSVMGKYFTRISRAVASLRGRVAQNENYFMDQPNRDNQDAANAVMGIVVEHIEPYIYWKTSLVDAILKYGDRLYTTSLPRAANPPRLTPEEVQPQFHVTNFNVRLEVEGDVVQGDIKAGNSGAILNLRRGLKTFFESNNYGVICAKGYCVGIWKSSEGNGYCLWEPHAVGPTGRFSPGGASALVLFATIDQLADTIKNNIETLMRPGSNKYSISSVKVFWEYSKRQGAVSPQGAVPDEGYEWKVLTAYVETARGRTILRGTRPPDLVKFTRDALLQSACGAIAGACMSHVRRPPLWTRRTVDDVMAVGSKLLAASLSTLGYEFRPGEDVLLPLQVLKRFVLGVNYVRYDLQSAYSGKLEQKEPTEMTVRCALERFFEDHSTGILWSMPHAVAVWRYPGSPPFYMFEPHACGATGLRADAQDDGAACVLTFTSPKLMAFAYLQNVPLEERLKHDFQLYAMSVTVQPIRKLGGVDPPLVRAPPGVTLIPATSKVNVDGSQRRAAEQDRKHPPGSATCLDAQRATEIRDKEDARLKGQRNSNGWLVLNDGTQFLSAQHSMACRRFSAASRGKQALACSVMAVAMSRVEDVCRWCAATLDRVLDSGDQLYQDSYLHYRPAQPYLKIQQVNVDGSQRRAAEQDRKHPPGSATCLDAQRATEIRDKEDARLKGDDGQRNSNGWLVLNDGTQFLSAQHSMACRRFSAASRGKQALACSVMAVAMSRVEDVCRWCAATLDRVLDSGDQLYQDSYLHYRPAQPYLKIQQILRKFYTPGNCVCRVVVYKARQTGFVDEDLETQVTEFFREERSGVFVAGNGEFSVALFRTPRGYYMFDPADRDRYGRAVAPPCIGRARACFSQYPNVRTLADKLRANIPPNVREPEKVPSEDFDETKKPEANEGGADKNADNLSTAKSEVRFKESQPFAIYGMDVTSLRRINKYEK
ncbi:hypothetical protein RR48_05617 [Papilio machaon]|uniref:Uncharacterized protein n=1 Tax=Papilio machaon TaxID=76193 RepID=A0A0N0PDW2_PAPMA|nr:hypothetical protein RR48_05617 [Papilio machaon]